jgi:hypothetical protein
MWNIRQIYSVEIYKHMMAMHYTNVIRLKTCSGMAKKVMGEYFGGRGPERQHIGMKPFEVLRYVCSRYGTGGLQ